LSLQPKTAVGLRRFGSFASLLAPLLAIFALWLSVVRAYHIPRIKVSDEMLQQGRDSPPDAVLDELKDFDFLQDRWQGKPELMAAASALLRGQLRFESCSAHINLPFSAAELEQIQAPCDLPFAGFFVPDVFLRAYEASGREEFLSAAQAFILGAHEYEEKVWLPREQFWNDHALSARVSVLANFWHFIGIRPPTGLTWRAR
jgi:hypothetical protein